MSNTVDKVLKIALDEVGYLEKKSNSNLYSKTANAGSNNYTKYGKEMHDIYPSVMDYPAAWCDAFVDWCFYKAYGVATAKSLIGGNFNDYTVSSAQMYKNKKAWYTSNPQVGDQIFFKNSTRINHTGLVYKVDSKYVYTVEGNTSSASGVVANGGCVVTKKYSLTYSKIAGYGRPKYDGVVEVNTEPSNANIYTLENFVRDVQNAIGAKVDGIAGSETLSKTITISAVKNRKSILVRYIQQRLNSIGFDSGVIDGIAGSKFTKAVTSFQRSNGCVADGEITAKGKTWKKLLGM